MGLMYFGSNGAYDLSSAQNAAAQQNAYQNIANQSYSYTSTNTLATLIGGTASIGQLAGVQLFPAPQGLIEAEKKVVKAAKRAARGILAKLRDEIDGWHADVLERCPA